MSSVILTGDTSGTLTVSAPLVAGSNTLTLPAATGTISLLTQATSVASTSGTSIDFTGIPSWVKRITVMFSGVSTNGLSTPWLIQIGDSGGIETSGYLGSGIRNTGAINSTTSFPLSVDNSAAVLLNGSITIVLINSSTNLWAASGVFGTSNAAEVISVAGSKPLSATLDRVRITTTNGTDTFDAGTINIMYEG